MDTGAIRLLRSSQLPLAVSVAVFFAVGIFSRAGFIGYACGLLLGTGLILNALVIAANSGCMPVAAELERAPEPYRERYKTIDGKTRLSALGDWINFGPCLISPGDVLIVLGFIGGIAARLMSAG